MFKEKQTSGLTIDDDICRVANLAALLHDIGHFPFSHATEVLVSENFEGQNHENLSSEIVKTPYMKSAFDIIEDKLKVDIDIKALSDFIVGSADKDKLYLANLVKGLIDADRMDYLVRDAHNTGVPFGRVDLERLVKTLTPLMDRDNWILAVEEKGKAAVESLIVARSLMHNAVYYHHTKRSSEAMLARATFSALNEDKTPILDLLLLSDDLLFAELFNSNEYSRDVASRLARRDLFKRIETLSVRDVGNVRALNDFAKKTLFEKIKHEKAICQEIGLENGYVILDFPEIPKTKEMDFPVILADNHFRPLSDLSLIAKAAEDQRKQDWIAYVFCSKKDAEVKEKIRRYLNINVGLSI